MTSSRYCIGKCKARVQIQLFFTEKGTFFLLFSPLKSWFKSKPCHLALRPWVSVWTLLRPSFLICKWKDGTSLTNVLWWLNEMIHQVLSAEQVICICSFPLLSHWGVNQWPGCIRMFLLAEHICSNLSGNWITRGQKPQMVLKTNQRASWKKKKITLQPCSMDAESDKLFKELTSYHTNIFSSGLWRKLT